MFVLCGVTSKVYVPVAYYRTLNILGISEMIKLSFFNGTVDRNIL